MKITSKSETVYIKDVLHPFLKWETYLKRPCFPYGQLNYDYVLEGERITIYTIFIGR